MVVIFHGCGMKTKGYELGLAQVAQVREHAERRIAQLHSRIQGLESRLHQLTQENKALSTGAAAAKAAGGSQVLSQTAAQGSPAMISCQAHYLGLDACLCILVIFQDEWCSQLSFYFLFIG
jgi:outer membrane murein-binding lipoprotein Lpp